MGERCISAKQNVALRLKAKKSPKRKDFIFSAAKHLARPHKYWRFRDMGIQLFSNEIDNSERGRKLSDLLAKDVLACSEIDNPVRGRKPSQTAERNPCDSNEIDNPVRGRERRRFIGCRCRICILR